jgi:hypothetical protein
MKAKLINEKISVQSFIDYEKLYQYAKAIEFCCAGEYGDTYLNISENHIWICLGDSNPFDIENLKRFIKEFIIKNYSDFDKIKITIKNESFPGDDEKWEKIN